MVTKIINRCDICHLCQEVNTECKACGVCERAVGKKHQTILLCGLECENNHNEKIHKLTMIQYNKQKRSNQDRLYVSIAELNDNRKINCY